MTATDDVINETDVVINEKDENTQGNSNTKPRLPKFINFSLLLGQSILINLYLHLWL